MSLDAVVRVSFQANTNANQSANLALVGHTQDPTGPRPFIKVGTALYVVRDGDDNDVGNALADFGTALSQHSGSIDYVSITMFRRDIVPPDQLIRE